MALYVVSAGAVVQAADLNQYYNLLTGVITDQPVSIHNSVTAFAGLMLGSSAPGAGPDVHADGTNIYIETNGAGSIILRPNGYGSSTNSASLNSAGLLSVPAVSAAGAVSAASVTASGSVIGHSSYFCVEGSDSTVRHIEQYYSSGSGSNIGSGSTWSTTFTYARAFAGGNPPAIGEACHIGGADPYVTSSIAHGGGGGNWTSVSLTYTNHDPNPQTVSQVSALAFGQ